MSDRFRLPSDLDSAERRAVVEALERHLAAENPLPAPWVLAGRLDATGVGALQARRASEVPWLGVVHRAFVRPGVPTFHGRGDAR